LTQAGLPAARSTPESRRRGQRGQHMATVAAMPSRSVGSFGSVAAAAWICSGHTDATDDADAAARLTEALLELEAGRDCGAPSEGGVVKPPQGRNDELSREEHHHHRDDHEQYRDDNGSGEVSLEEVPFVARLARFPILRVNDRRHPLAHRCRAESTRGPGTGRARPRPRAAGHDCNTQTQKTHKTQPTAGGVVTAVPGEAMLNSRSHAQLGRRTSTDRRSRAPRRPCAGPTRKRRSLLAPFKVGMHVCMTPPPVRTVTAYAEERRLPPSVTQSAESLLCAERSNT